MKNFIKPNWEQSNISISATLAEFLGSSNKNATLPALKTKLSTGYKNIIFICLDGMGINPIKINLDKTSFLRKNISQVLTSTSPSTTTNATTSLSSNKYPLEHGWFGWGLHFGEINRNIDIYLHADSQTGDKVEYSYPIYNNADCYFNHTSSDYEINAVIPEYVKTGNLSTRINIENEFELCDAIRKICSKAGTIYIRLSA